MRIEKGRWWRKRWFTSTCFLKQNEFLLPTNRKNHVAKQRSSLIIFWIGLAANLFLMVSLSTPYVTGGDRKEAEFRQFVFQSLMDSLPPVQGPNSVSKAEYNNKIKKSSNETFIRAVPINRVLVYPAAHTDDNAPSVVDGVEEVVEALYRRAEEAPLVVLHKVDNDHLQPPLPHFDTGTQYTYQLMQERSAIPHIQYIPGDWHEDYNNINSLNEMQRLMRYCMANEIEALVVVSTPFHLPRSFLSALSVLAQLQEAPGQEPSEQRHPLRIYAKAAQPREYNYWNRVVSHSQGTLIGARSDFVQTERARIEKYTRTGDLIPLEQALRMLRERDSPN